MPVKPLARSQNLVVVTLLPTGILEILPWNFLLARSKPTIIFNTRISVLNLSLNCFRYEHEFCPWNHTLLTQICIVDVKTTGSVSNIGGYCLKFIWKPTNDYKNLRFICSTNQFYTLIIIFMMHCDTLTMLLSLTTWIFFSFTCMILNYFLKSNI